MLDPDRNWLLSWIQILQKSRGIFADICIHVLHLLAAREALTEAWAVELQAEAIIVWQLKSMFVTFLSCTAPIQYGQHVGTESIIGCSQSCGVLAGAGTFLGHKMEPELRFFVLLRFKLRLQLWLRPQSQYWLYYTRFQTFLITYVNHKFRFILADPY